jgi:hypothetical protein
MVYASSEMAAAREAMDLLYPLLTHLSATPAGKASSNQEEPPESPPLLLSSFKIGTRGVICLRLSPTFTPAANTTPGMAAQQAALTVHEAVNDGKLPPVRHLHRVVPIISTCRLEVDDLQACAARVAPVAAAILAKAPIRPTFGISIHNRDHTSEAARANNPEASGGHLPSRNEIIGAVAQGLVAELKAKHAIDTVAVDLTNPSLVVVVEVLPVMGSLFAGIAVLPQHVCSLKPKLTLRGLQHHAPSQIDGC